jgi:Fe-Mn family superoxide dismutase
MDFVQPGKHESFPLPFDYNALEPVISAETLRLHHDILHKSSIDSLNITERELSEAIKGTDYDIINHLRNELSYYSSDVILHSIYWTTLAPAGQGGQPGIDTASQIARCFGSFPLFRE